MMRKEGDAWKPFFVRRMLLAPKIRFFDNRFPECPDVVDTKAPCSSLHSCFHVLRMTAFLSDQGGRWVPGKDYNQRCQQSHRLAGSPA